jgi:hypothetical protein
MHFREYAHHHVAFVLLGLFCAWLSFSLIARMWLKYRKDSFLKKAGWSIILCIPFFGWLFYGALYKPLGDHDVPISPNADIMAGGH